MTTLCCTASATRWHTQSVTLKPFNRLLQSSAVVMHFADFRFDNSSLHALPVEFVPDDTRLVQPQRQVKGACWSPIKPEPVKSPVLVAASLPCLGLLDLQAAQVCTVAVPALHLPTHPSTNPAFGLRFLFKDCAWLFRSKIQALLSTSVATGSCLDQRLQPTATLVTNLGISAVSWVMAQLFILGR